MLAPGVYLRPGVYLLKSFAYPRRINETGVYLKEAFIQGKYGIQVVYNLVFECVFYTTFVINTQTE